MNKPGLNKSGFLLFELMLVVALVGILAMLGISSFEYLQHILVHNDAERLYSFILAERAQAMAKGKQQELRVDVAKNILIGAGMYGILSNGVIFGAPNKTFGPPSQPSEHIKNPCTFVNNTLILESNGTINAGSLYLTNSKKSCCYALTVPTGSYPFLRLYKWDAKKWHLVT